MGDYRWESRRAYTLEPSPAQGVKLVAGQMAIWTAAAGLLGLAIGAGLVWFFGVPWRLAGKLWVIAVSGAGGLGGFRLLAAIWDLWWHYAPPDAKPPAAPQDPRLWIDGNRMLPVLERIARELARVEALPGGQHRGVGELVRFLWPPSAAPLRLRGAPERPQLPACAARTTYVGLGAGTVEGTCRELEQAVPAAGMPELGESDTYHILRQAYADHRCLRARYWINRRLPSGQVLHRTLWDRLRARVDEAGLLEPAPPGSTRPRRLQRNLGVALAALGIVQVCSCAGCAAARGGPQIRKAASE